MGHGFPQATRDSIVRFIRHYALNKHHKKRIGLEIPKKDSKAAGKFGIM